MFENNNVAIVKRLAKKSLHADRRRNIFIIVTIAIAACLMATISLIETGVRQENLNKVDGMYQAAIFDVSQETLKALKVDPALDGAGEYYSISENKLQDFTISCIYMDEDVLRLGKFSWEGVLPSRTYDVMLEKAYLAKLGEKSGIGDTIILNLGNGNREYRITGFIQYPSKSADTTRFSVIRSKSSFAVDDASRFVYIRLASTANLSASLLKEAIFETAQRHGINRENISASSSYFHAIEPMSMGNLLSIIGIAAMISFGSALVIYSIFYISVTGKVREYGQLRTIGTTKKQVKKMVFQEGIYLSLIGIPSGLITACIVAIMIVPKGWNTANTLKICMAVAFFTFVIVSLAIRRPMKIASATPPVEAIRYSAASEVMKTIKTKKLHRKLSPFYLATINFTRNRKKSVLTLLSLGFSGILLMCAASYSSSLSVETLVREGGNFTYGNYKLSLSSDSSDNSDGYAMSRIQQNNPLNENMEKEILAIDGVTGIQIDKAAKVHYTLPDGTREGDYVSAFTESDIANINDRLISGTCDYRQCMEQNGIIVMVSDLLEDIYGSSPAVGDKVTFEFYTPSGVVQKEYTVLGIMNARLKDGIFLMPNETLQNVMGINVNTTFSIASDSIKKDNVETALRTITASDASLSLETLDDMIAEKEAEFHTMSFVLYSIVLVIALFGIISLINTVITNVLSRKQELGVLQAIGLSNTQMNQMLQSEGMIYTLGTIVTTLTVGSVLGWLLCENIHRHAEVPYINYHFPLIPALLFFAVFLVIQVCISFVLSNSMKKQSLVERMRGA